MKFSICIPNYNYERYLGETLESAVNQHYNNYEVVISDNASTDKSLEIIKNYAKQYDFIRYKVNQTNVGFAGNLDKSAEMATGDWIIMLSSDDLMTKEALNSYELFISNAVKKYGTEIAFCSAFDKIDGESKYLEYIGPSKRIWFEEDIDKDLSAMLGCNVYKVESATALRRCLTFFYNPFNFASTCFPASVYNKVEGYSSSRLINPDKWFHWKLLCKTGYVFYIDKPLFKYRWHNHNQASQQTQSGALKFWIDEYRSSFEISSEMLSKSGFTAEEVATAFVNRSVFPYVFKHLKLNERKMAFRIFAFGMATYPHISFKSRKTYLLFLLILLGPIGVLLTRMISKASSS